MLSTVIGKYQPKNDRHQPVKRDINRINKTSTVFLEVSTVKRKHQPKLVHHQPNCQYNKKTGAITPVSHYFIAFSSLDIILIALPVPIATDSNGFGAI